MHGVPASAGNLFCGVNDLENRLPNYFEKEKKMRSQTLRSLTNQSV